MSINLLIAFCNKYAPLYHLILMSSKYYLLVKCGMVSSFRKDWALDPYGKWAEFDYTAVSYPWFACGSGYILSRDLVVWLAENRKLLKRFQV